MPTVAVGTLDDPVALVPLQVVERPEHCLFGPALTVLHGASGDRFVAAPDCPSEAFVDGIALLGAQGSVEWLPHSAIGSNSTGRAPVVTEEGIAVIQEEMLRVYTVNASHTWSTDLVPLPVQRSSALFGMAGTQQAVFMYEGEQGFLTDLIGEHSEIRTRTETTGIGDVYDVDRPASVWGVAATTFHLDDTDRGVVWIPEGALSAPEDWSQSAYWSESTDWFLRPLAVGDLDDDGHHDFVVGVRPSSGLAPSQVKVMRGPLGGGSLEDAPTWIEARGIGYEAAVGDFDGDGALDLATTDRGREVGHITIYRGPLPEAGLGPADADQTFTVAAPLDPSMLGIQLNAADLDADGTHEIAATIWNDETENSSVYVFKDVMRPWLEANGR